MFCRYSLLLTGCDAGRHHPEADKCGVGDFQSIFDMMVPFESIANRYSEIFHFVNWVNGPIHQTECVRAVLVMYD